jgi:prevent-host-death family protein
MIIRMGAREARQKLSELVGRVHYGGDTVILESSGRPMAAVVPLEMYDRMMAEREERFQIIDEIRARMPQVSEEEAEADIAEALAAVRARNDPGRP